MEYRDLADLLKRSTKALEIKRALAVSRDVAGESRPAIGSVLGVSRSFISKWRLVYDKLGVNGLRLSYQGARPRAYLSAAQKQAVLKHVSSQATYSYEALVEHLQRAYGITYKSPQSYYDLLHEAGFRRKRSQSYNPKRDGHSVKVKRRAIKKN